MLQGIAVLGGIEMTALLAGGLALYLARRDRAGAAAAVGAFGLLLAVEIVLNRLLPHAGPPPTLAHADRPSIISSLFHAPLRLRHSFPSWHMTRTVFTYGLFAHVWSRADSSVARRLATPGAWLLVLLMVFTRLYLGVHWQSDVIGGALLGWIGRAGALVWLRRGRPGAPGEGESA